MNSSLDRPRLDAVASLALVSALFALIALLFLGQVLLGKGRPHAMNQPLVLIFCFMVGNFFLSIGFVLSFQWARQDGILEDNALCFVQGGFLTFGSLSSGLFAFAIAIHSLYVHATGTKVNMRNFLAGVTFIWTISALLPVIGPIRYGHRFYGEVSMLCWIHEKYYLERLLVHDIWLFLTEFGTLLTYLALAVLLIVRLNGRKNTEEEAPLTQTNLNTITATMMLFPMAHIINFLLLVTARLMGIAGKQVPPKLLLIAACFLASSGWLSSLLFAAAQDILMRPSLITIPPPPTPPASPDIPRLTRPPRRASPSGPYGSRVSAEATLLGSRRVSVTSTPNGNRLSKRLSAAPEGVSNVNVKQDMSVEEEEFPPQDLSEERMLPRPNVDADEIARLERFGMDPYEYNAWP